MAGLADACSSSDDYAHPYRWSGLASVCPGLQHQSFFSAADHLLDHSRNPPPHSLAVAYLASLLAQSLRKKGVELEEKREELLSLQDFTEDIIHSMRGGLITTDL